MNLSNARVLVTGATGFVGGHVGAALSTRSADVFAFSRHSSPRSGDIRDQVAVLEATRGADAVIHLAVSPGYRAEQDPRADAEVNIVGTLNVLLAARELGVRRVVHVSSAHVYGSAREMASEDDLPEPTSLYGVSKLASEEYARMFARTHGIRLTVLRPSILYGEAASGDPPRNVVTRFTECALAGQPIVITGDPNRRLDLLHVTDAAHGCVLALERDPGSGSIFNLGGGAPVSLVDLARMIVAACSSRSPIRTGDSNQAGALPVLDAAKATRELGFVPSTDMVTGIARFVEGRSRSLPHRG